MRNTYPFVLNCLLQISDQLKYVKGACKPTKTLFISNVSEEVTEECIIALFNKYDEINKFKSQPIKEGKKNFTATIEMNSEDTVSLKRKRLKMAKNWKKLEKIGKKSV